MGEVLAMLQIVKRHCYGSIAQMVHSGERSQIQTFSVTVIHTLTLQVIAHVPQPGDKKPCLIRRKIISRAYEVVSLLR